MNARQSTFFVFCFVNNLIHSAIVYTLRNNGTKASTGAVPFLKIINIYHYVTKMHTFGVIKVQRSTFRNCSFLRATFGAQIGFLLTMFNFNLCSGENLSLGSIHPLTFFSFVLHVIINRFFIICKIQKEVI